MTNEEILAELRTIRTLLALDKEQKLNEYTNDLDEVQKEILGELEYEEWSSLSTSDIAEAFDTSQRTVQRGLGELIDSNLIQKRGAGRGTEYRKTGLLRAAEMIGDV